MKHLFKGSGQNQKALEVAMNQTAIGLPQDRLYSFRLPQESSAISAASFPRRKALHPTGQALCHFPGSSKKCHQ